MLPDPFGRLRERPLREHPLLASLRRLRPQRHLLPDPMPLVALLC